MILATLEQRKGEPTVETEPYEIQAITGYRLP